LRVPVFHQRKPRGAASASREVVGEEKPKVGNVMCKVTGPKGFSIGVSKGACGVEDHLPREGTLDRESVERVTAFGGETILAALTVCCSSREIAKRTRREGGDRGVRVGRSRSSDLDEVTRFGTNTPPRPRRSAKRFGRRENARFLGPGGRNPPGIRRAQALTMNREQASTGAR